MTLDEQERRAYANGDTAQAALLRELIVAKQQLANVTARVQALEAECLHLRRLLHSRPNP